MQSEFSEISRRICWHPSLPLSLLLELFCLVEIQKQPPQFFVLESCRSICIFSCYPIKTWNQGTLLYCFLWIHSGTNLCSVLRSKQEAPCIKKHLEMVLDISVKDLSEVALVLVRSMCHWIHNVLCLLSSSLIWLLYPAVFIESLYLPITVISEMKLLYSK